MDPEFGMFPNLCERFRIISMNGPGLDGLFGITANKGNDARLSSARESALHHVYSSITTS